MENLLTEEELINFEDDIANSFNNKEIRAPIHLYFGNEKQMLEIFKDVQPNDWVVCSWRSHYQCLLKGMDPKKVKADILDGRSIEMCNAEHKVFSSAIVGGNIPIALGLAIDIARKGTGEKVWCFIGDMTSSLGVFHEALQYASNNNLPIVFVIEDNGVSVCTDTKYSWGSKYLPYFPYQDLEKIENGEISKSTWLWYYKYDLNQKYNHAGTGTRIEF